MPVEEFKLPFLADELILSGLLVKVLADDRHAGCAGRDNLQAADFLVAEADFFIEKEDVIFKLSIQSLELADLLLELVATVVGTAQLLGPDLRLVLVGARLGPSAD